LQASASPIQGSSDIATHDPGLIDFTKAMVEQIQELHQKSMVVQGRKDHNRLGSMDITFEEKLPILGRSEVLQASNE
jgi:hypothetical protein